MTEQKIEFGTGKPSTHFDPNLILICLVGHMSFSVLKRELVLHSQCKEKESLEGGTTTKAKGNPAKLKNELERELRK